MSVTDDCVPLGESITGTIQGGTQQETSSLLMHFLSWFANGYVCLSLTTSAQLLTGKF